MIETKLEQIARLKIELNSAAGIDREHIELQIKGLCDELADAEGLPPNPGDNDPALNEQSKHQEPSTDFDWDAVFSALGESGDEQTTQRNYSELVTALRRIFNFALDVDLGKTNAVELVGKRTIALAWVIDPQRFEGASMRKLAERIRYSFPRLSKITASASREFNIRNRNQTHDWRNKK